MQVRERADEREALTSLAGSDELEAEAVLMLGVARGEPEACRQVIRQQGPSAYRFAFKILRDSVEAEDIAQEAMVRLWRQAPDWRPLARISTWLHKVIYRLALDRLRRRREEGLDAAEALPDLSPGPEARFAAVQRRALVRAAMEQLPERQRTAVLLTHFQGLSGAEAASVLEVSIEALESLLARARRSLRTLLADNRAELLERDDG
jgi:RNA polymerase sigma factor (sigma-70 family)